MLLTNSIATFGRYCLFMKRVFALPDKWKVFGKRILDEVVKLGVDSIPLVLIISVFIGAVIAIQMQLNIMSPLIPAYTVGLATRDIVLLEFSNSILCLILAGKVGSNIASEIGTMRVTEQIDALEIMGVNSANYLVLPKIIAFVGFMPVLGMWLSSPTSSPCRAMYMASRRCSRNGTCGMVSLSRLCSRLSSPRWPLSSATM